MIQYRAIMAEPSKKNPLFDFSLLLLGSGEAR